MEELMRYLDGLWMGLCAAVLLTGCGLGELSEEEKEVRNARFDAVERAYAPQPVNLRGKNVLYLGYRNQYASNGLFECDDVCRYLIDGTTGARMYYALTEWPATPDFLQPVDLRSLVEGSFQAGRSRYDIPVRPIASGAPPLRIDYVVINLRPAMTPALDQIFVDYGLARDAGEAWEVFAKVDDARAFRLVPANALYVDFGRATRMGQHNSYLGTYSFPYSRLDHDAQTAELRRVFCGWRCQERPL